MGDKMRLFDPKFRANKGRYFTQTILAAAVVAFVLILIDAPAQSVLVASVGSTAFIVFAMPHRAVSKPRYVLGGYAVCFLVGVPCHFLYSYALSAGLHGSAHVLMCLAGGLAVAASTLGMVVTNTEHPPAAGLALGLVLNGWQPGPIVVALACVALVSGAKQVLREALIDLL